ncbi:MAG: hypothetical protein MUF18_19765 [Fimbriiglobus sp.]|jgi:hypothetical protein|nr:hypothetical protein [Fimbriiglobus sp.]
MLRCYCDVCGKELHSGQDGRYTVRVEARRVCEPVELTAADLDGQDDPDHLDAMEQLLADAETEATLHHPPELPPAPKAREFDLCGGCYCRFHSDPFGFERRRSLYTRSN